MVASKNLINTFRQEVFKRTRENLRFALFTWSSFHAFGVKQCTKIDIQRKIFEGPTTRGATPTTKGAPRSIINCNEWPKYQRKCWGVPTIRGGGAGPSSWLGSLNCLPKTRYQKRTSHYFQTYQVYWNNFFSRTVPYWKRFLNVIFENYPGRQ